MKYLTNYDVKKSTLHIIKQDINKYYIRSNCGIILYSFLPYEKDDINIFKYPKCQRCFRKEFKELI